MHGGRVAAGRVEDRTRREHILVGHEATGARAHEVDGGRILCGGEPAGGGCHGGPVHHRPHEHLGGVVAGGQGCGAVGGCDYNRPARHAFGRVLSRRVAQIEAGDPHASPLPAE